MSRNERDPSAEIGPTCGVADPAPPAGDGLTPASGDQYDPAARGLRSGERTSMASFGEMLRRERELRRISLREVSETTKINIRYLEALERNEFDYLPGGAFTRGFIRAYARCIGVDDGKMLDAFRYELQQQASRRANGADAGRPSDPLEPHPGALGEFPEQQRRRRARRNLLLALALLLLLALAGAGWAGWRLWSAAPETTAPEAASNLPR